MVQMVSVLRFVKQNTATAQKELFPDYRCYVVLTFIPTKDYIRSTRNNRFWLPEELAALEDESLLSVKLNLHPLVLVKKKEQATRSANQPANQKAN